MYSKVIFKYSTKVLQLMFEFRAPLKLHRRRNSAYYIYATMSVCEHMMASNTIFRCVCQKRTRSPDFLIRFSTFKVPFTHLHNRSLISRASPLWPNCRAHSSCIVIQLLLNGFSDTISLIWFLSSVCAEQRGCVCADGWFVGGGKLL